MKKLMILVLLIFGFVGSAHALPFTFYGVDDGGVGSANMDIAISGNTLTLTLDNTSPITLESGTGDNAPAITGFGFNLSNDPSPVVSWSLVAYDRVLSGNKVIGSSTDSSLLWTLGTTQSGVTLDYIDYLQNVKGGLYNPVAYNGLAALPNYFTTATLTIVFDGTPVLETVPEALNASGSISGITYVRMQNVGEDGAGSLKLPNTVPEPTTMLLLGIGLVGIAGVGRKFKK